MPEKLPCVIYMQKDDPATIPSLRHRNTLRHMEWSQLSFTISDIGLRELTLLCRECFVTSLKFCCLSFPKPGLTQSHRSSHFWDRHKPIITQRWQRQGCREMLAEMKGTATYHLLLWNQRKPTVLNRVRDVLRLSTRFTQFYPQKAENFITPKQRSWKREIPRILTPRLQWASYKPLSSCWD